MNPGAHWPYPFWIAHRGAGALAPENTLAALRLAASRGWRMFECDVQLSADGVPFLLHDPTLDRTTDGSGPAAAMQWSELHRLDAGSWHSPSFAGEPLATLASVANWCIARQKMLDIEIKPASGAGFATGQSVASAAARLWRGSVVPPLISSFSETALQGVRDAAPELPRGLLLDALPADWVQRAGALQCVAVILEHTLCSRELLAQARAVGLRTLAYTVDEPAAVAQLRKWRIDGIITNRIADFAPAAAADRAGDAPD